MNSASIFGFSFAKDLVFKRELLDEYETFCENMGPTSKERTEYIALKQRFEHLLEEKNIAHFQLSGPMHEAMELIVIPSFDISRLTLLKDGKYQFSFGNNLIRVLKEDNLILIFTAEEESFEGIIQGMIHHDFAYVNLIDNPEIEIDNLPSCIICFLKLFIVTHLPNLSMTPVQPGQIAMSVKGHYFVNNETFRIDYLSGIYPE